MKTGQFLGQNVSVQEVLGSYCRRSFLGSISVTIGSGRHPIQDEDHYGSGPHPFPGSLFLNSGMCSEMVRSVPDIVVSGEINVVLLKCLKCYFLFY